MSNAQPLGAASFAFKPQVVTGKAHYDMSIEAGQQRSLEKLRLANLLDAATPPLSEPLDENWIRHTIQTDLESIQICYEHLLATDPTRRGTTTVVFRINMEGRVRSASASGFDPVLDDCVLARIQMLKFPPADASGVTVRYPFAFQPG